jgi:hypothetical protein
MTPMRRWIITLIKARVRLVFQTISRPVFKLFSLPGERHAKTTLRRRSSGVSPTSKPLIFSSAKFAKKRKFLGALWDHPHNPHYHFRTAGGEPHSEWISKAGEWSKRHSRLCAIIINGTNTTNEAVDYNPDETRVPDLISIDKPASFQIINSLRRASHKNYV